MRYMPERKYFATVLRLYSHVVYYQTVRGIQLENKLL